MRSIIKGAKTVRANHDAARCGMIMPLIGTAFSPGACNDAVEAFSDPDYREMARAEHCLFTGRANEAVSKATPLLVHADPAIRMSAHIVYCISSLTLGNVDDAQKTLESLEHIDTQESAPITGGYCADVVRILLHLPEQDSTNLDEIPAALPEGVRFFLCYVLALRAYLRGEYGKAEGIALAALTLDGNRYPIPGIYLHVVSTISLVRQERLAEAAQHFMAAWELALPDGLISPFWEHYVLLSGFNKKLIKPELSEKHRQISDCADRYFSAWIDMHNSHSEQYVAPGLTKMESTVTMLFSRGWSVEAIARHLDISKNTVKSHLSATYHKLGVNNREQLRDYLLR